MAVYILEDQVIQATYLRRLVEELLFEDGISTEDVQVYYKGADLIQAVKHSVDSNIFFLDIKIKEDEEAGLEIAQKIRKLDSNAIIAFVTTHQQLALKSYKYMVSALTFIDKNVDDSKFRHQVKQSLTVYFDQKGEVLHEQLVIDQLSPPLHIKWRDLFYFEVVGNHMIRLNARNRFVEFYGSLTDLSSLDTRLWRIHQAFLVNKEQIRFYNRKERHLYLFDGTRIPVTRTYYKRLETELQEYEGEAIE